MAKLICILNGDEEGLENIYDKLAKDLKFPSYFGRNLDALDECLVQDVSDAEVTWENSELAKQKLGKVFGDLVKTFEDASKENPGISFYLK